VTIRIATVRGLGGAEGRDMSDMRGESDKRVRDLRDERARVTRDTLVSLVASSPRVTYDPLVSLVNLFEQLGGPSK